MKFEGAFFRGILSLLVGWPVGTTVPINGAFDLLFSVEDFQKKEKKTQSKHFVKHPVPKRTLLVGSPWCTPEKQQLCCIWMFRFNTVGPKQ
jgi:hypothetical protein